MEGPEVWSEQKSSISVSFVSGISGNEAQKSASQSQALEIFGLEQLIELFHSEGVENGSRQSSSK